MSASVLLALPLRVVSVLNERTHWAKRARRTAEQRSLVRMSLAGQRAWPLVPPVVVTLTRIAPRSLDGDNLQGALKAVRDGVADALGVDDRHPSIRWEYAQRRGAPRQYGIELQVVELP